MLIDRRHRALSCAVATTAAAVLFAAPAARAVTSYTGGSYIQNFDTLYPGPTYGGALPQNEWTDDVTLPGWYFTQTLSTDNEGGYQRLRASSGGGTNPNTGSLYSYGVNNTSERALGFLSSNTLAPVGDVGMWVALRLRNDTGNAYDSFTLKYNGEQYRDGGLTTGFPTPTAQKIEFSYKTDAVGLTDPNYNRVASLDFTSPVFANTGGGAAVLGNSAGRVAINSDGSVVVTGLNWQPGQDLWIRWTDINDPSSDHALAVDDLDISFGGATAATGSPTWKNAGTGGNWSDTANWLNGTVAGSGSFARLSSSMTADQTVNLDTSPTVSGLLLSPSHYLYHLTASAGQSLTIASGGEVAVSNSPFVKTQDTSTRAAPDNMTNSVPVGPFNVSAPLNFAGEAKFNVGFLATLSLNAPLTTGAGAGLTKTGSGTLVLTQANSYSGPTTVSAGTLSFSNTNQLGDDSPTNGLVIQNGAGINPTADIVMTRPFSFDTGGITVRSDNLFTMGALVGPGVFRKVLAGTTTVSTIDTLGLTISAVNRSVGADAGIFRIAPDAPTTPTIQALRVETDATNGIFLGRFDLTNNALVYEYTGATSPLTGTPSLNGVTSTKVATALWYAYNGGAWDRQGIMSSWINSTEHDPNGIHSIAAADATELLGITGSDTATFAGKTVDATSVLLMYTLAGDLNMNGRIDADDYAVVDANIAKGTWTVRQTLAAEAGLHAHWVNGDFNFDGAVDLLDLGILDRTLSFTTGGLSPAFLASREAQYGSDYVSGLVASIPEPASLGVVGAAAVGLLGRRRRSR